MYNNLRFSFSLRNNNYMIMINAILLITLKTKNLKFENFYKSSYTYNFQSNINMIYYYNFTYCNINYKLQHYLIANIQTTPKRKLSIKYSY